MASLRRRYVQVTGGEAIEGAVHSIEGAAFVIPPEVRTVGCHCRGMIIGKSEGEEL